MGGCCFVIYFILALFGLIYALIDVNHFIRAVYMALVGHFFGRKRRFDEVNCMKDICFLNDGDILMTAMGNARYLRALDLARFRFFAMTKVVGVILTSNVSFVQGATWIRYRRPIKMFMPFKILTKLAYYDDKALYFEHKFITGKDKFVNAVAYSKQSITGKSTVPQFFEKIKVSNLSLPKMPEDLKLWIESMDASSSQLKLETTKTK